jgi:hypothetical protein
MAAKFTIGSKVMLSIPCGLPYSNPKRYGPVEVALITSGWRYAMVLSTSTRAKADGLERRIGERLV